MKLVNARLNYGQIGLLVALFALIGVGCGGDDESNAEPRPTPRYAVATTVIGTSTSDVTAYLAFVETLDEGQVDIAAAFELPGGAKVWGVKGSGEFYVTRPEDLSITKYGLGSDGQPEELGRLGLLGIGVGNLVDEVMAFGGPSRGYLFDLVSARAVELDLDLMEIVGTRDISSWLDATQPTHMGFAPFSIERDGELVGVIYGGDVEQASMSDVSQIVYLEPTTGEFELFEAPCGGLTYGIKLSNGDIVFSADPWVAGLHAIDASRAPEPCLIRIPAGSRAPDTEVLRLNELTGKPTGGLIPAGPDTAYLRVLDTDAMPITEETTAYVLYGVPAWQTWEIDLTDYSVEQLERDPLGGAIVYFNVGEGVFENVSSADFSATTLYRTTGPGAPSAGVEIPGIPQSLVELR